MKFTDEKESDFFVAIMSSIFTFCFMFLGVRLSSWYYLAGFVCLIVGIVFWVKVKNADSDEF